MKRDKKPRYLVAKRYRGALYHYWQPDPKLRAHGWTPRRLPDDAIEAHAEALRINAELDKWREAQPGEAPAGKTPGPWNSVDNLVAAYLKSRGYLKLRPTTQANYRNRLKFIAAWAGDKGADRITPKAAEKYYEALIDQRGLHMANAIIRVARLLFVLGIKEGYARQNPFRGELLRLTGAKPRVVIWTLAEIEALVEALDAAGDHGVADAVVCAYCTGQRQTDVLAASETFIDGERWRLRQSKTSAVVAVKIMPWLHDRWTAARARKTAAGVDAPQIHIDDKTGAPFVGDTFRHRFSEARDTLAKKKAFADVKEKRFQDFRDTAVTALVRSGSRKDEVAAVTGHKLETIDALMRHYLLIDTSQADAAMDKRIAAEANKP